MSMFRKFTSVFCANVVFAVISGQACAHFDIFLSRPVVGTQTVIGGAEVDHLEYDDTSRVFEAELGSVLGEWITLEPGVNHPNLLLPVDEFPASAAGLQPGDVLSLFKREFAIGSFVDDLFYWSGVGPVDFTPAAAGFRLDAADPLDGVAGVGGAFEDHPFLVVDSDAIGGIYLASLVGRVAGFEDSKPVYVVMGTPGFEEELELAVEYVQSTLAVPEPGVAVLLAGCVGAVFMRRRK